MCSSRGCTYCQEWSDSRNTCLLCRSFTFLNPSTCSLPHVVNKMCKYAEIFPYTEPAPRAHMNMGFHGTTIVVYGGTLSMTISEGRENTAGAEIGDVWEFRLLGQGYDKPYRWVRLFDDDIFEVPFKRQRASSCFAAGRWWLYGGTVENSPKGAMYRFSQYVYRQDPCLGGANCDPNAQCFRASDGSATCVCDDGFEG